MYNAGKYVYGEILPIKSIYGTLDNDRKEKVAFKAYLQVTCNLTYTSVIVTNGLRTYTGYIDSSGSCIIEITKSGKYFIVGKHDGHESIPEQIEIRDNSHLYEFDIEIDNPEPQPISYITFSSAEPFTLGFTYKAWDGIIEYSVDKEFWEEWDGLTVLSSNSENELYIRGIGNTRMHDSEKEKGSFVLESTAGVECIGNIEFLLDYQTVLDGQHPIMAEYCFSMLFADCGALITAPEFCATELSPYCYHDTFYNCRSLETAPALPATTLAENCYRYMFEDCTSLTTPPELPATTLAKNCYYNMFHNCALTTAPALPAITLAESCYEQMFSACDSLTTPPELPATILYKNCYKNMFNGCRSLTSAPELPATTLTESCYERMFCNCRSLVVVPKLPATTLAKNCYNRMFYGCSLISTPVELLAISLEDSCYSEMFKGCTSIKISQVRTHEYTTPYRIPVEGTGIIAEDSLYGMFEDTGGTFIDTPIINTTYYLWNPITYLTFSSNNPFTLGVTNRAWNGTVEYSLDKSTWLIWYGSSALSSNINNELYLRGSNNTTFATQNSQTTFVITSTSGVDCNGNIENLLDYQTVLSGQHPVMATHCFRSLFFNCTSLTTAPELPATTLSDYCYSGMFFACTSLTNAPELPATTLANYCYNTMFNGCTSLTVAPELPATTLASHCYNYMFNGCASLTTVPALPATTLVEGCYRGMFKECISLTTPSSLPAATLTESCYYNMFTGCTSIKLSETQTSEYNIPYRIPTTGNGTTANNALYDMFYNTRGTFRGTPTINTTYYLWNPITYLTFSSDDPFTLGVTSKRWNGTVEYSIDKINWITWDGSSILSSNNANEIYLRGYENTRFAYYISYTTIPCTTFVINSISGVRCTGNIENLLNYPAVLNDEHPTMSSYCYYGLFKNCDTLIATPELPAVTLSECCYGNMFYGCISLLEAPQLPATTMAVKCYQGMFYGCTGLIVAPVLPAMTMAQACYGLMFYGCESLEMPPQLPATALIGYCYTGMFQNCTSLITLPDLTAVELPAYCYSSMFDGCTSIKLSVEQTSEYTIPYRIPTEGTSHSTHTTALDNMFIRTGGTFKGTPQINTTYYLWNPITYLTFSSDDPFTLGVTNKGWDGTVEYSSDKSTWTTWDGSTTLSSNSNNELYLRGTGNTYISYYQIRTQFVITATSGVRCDGNIENLVDYQTVLNGEQPAGIYFYMLFYNCEKLVSAPSLPSTHLGVNSYAMMFSGCTSLTTAPDLPATILADYCYNSMFEGCTSLTNLPALPATTLASRCYQNMFKGCTSLTATPVLPATTLATNCYYQMFQGCTSLVTVPELPAITLTENCYAFMFSGCTSLKVSQTQTENYTVPYRIPSQGTGTVGTYSLNNMFAGTGGTFTGTPLINTTYYLWNPISAVDFFITSYATYTESRGLENTLFDNGTESSISSPMEKSLVRELANNLWEEYNAITQEYNDIDAWMLDFLYDLSYVAQVGENVSFTMSQELVEWFDNFADWVLGTKYGLTSTEQGYEHTTGSFDNPLVSYANLGFVKLTSEPVYIGTNADGNDIYVSSTFDDVYVAYYNSGFYYAHYGLIVCSMSSSSNFILNGSTSGLPYTGYEGVRYSVNNYTRVTTQELSGAENYDTHSAAEIAFVNGDISKISTVKISPQEEYTDLPIPVPDTTAQGYTPESLTGDWTIIGTSGMKLEDVIDEIVEFVQSNKNVVEVSI